MPKPRKNDSINCTYFSWKIFDRKGTWYADGRSNPQNLGRCSLATGDRDEALRALRQLDLIKAVEHGLADKSLLTPAQTDSLSLDEGWKLYLGSITARKAIEGLSAKTFKRYRAVRDKFLKFCQERRITSCQQITKKLLMEYAAWLDSESYAYATEYLEITTLKQLVKYLVDEGHLPTSALIQLPMSKPTETDTYCYRPEEAAAIIAYCQPKPELKWLHGIVTALAYTGMRISELASLRWTDIDFDKKLIKLTDERHSAARRGKKDTRELKGKRSRSFPIHPELLPVLQSIPPSPDGRVFHGPLGGHLKPDTVRRCLIRDVLEPLRDQFPTPAGAAIGFIDGRLHSFRHFFCSVCANAGVAEQTLMSWLGHRSSQMIRRYYHLHDQASQQAMEKIPALKILAK